MIFKCWRVGEPTARLWYRRLLDDLEARRLAKGLFPQSPGDTYGFHQGDADGSVIFDRVSGGVLYGQKRAIPNLDTVPSNCRWPAHPVQCDTLVRHGHSAFAQRARDWLFHCCACRTNRRVMHTPHIGRRARIGSRFWSGRCHRRRNLWLRCWIGSDVHFKLLGQSTSMATPVRWGVSLLSGSQDPVGKTRRTSGLGQRKWPRRCLCLNVFADAHESDDNHFLCGDLCGLGFGKHKGELRVCGSFGLGRFHWLSPVVARSERCCWPSSGNVHPSRIAMGQQNFRCDHNRVWLVCSSERVMMESRYAGQRTRANNGLQPTVLHCAPQRG